MLIEMYGTLDVTVILREHQILYGIDKIYIVRIVYAPP